VWGADREDVMFGDRADSVGVVTGDEVDLPLMGWVDATVSGDRAFTFDDDE
jgi:hypothetical protein